MALLFRVLFIMIETLALGALGSGALNANLWWDVVDDAAERSRRR